MIDANLLLRNLNFVVNDDENERESDDEHNRHWILNDDYSIATMPKAYLPGREDEDTAALFTSLGINGRL